MLALTACGEERAAPSIKMIEQDPLVARALNDPLMVDPDLSLRNEANAVVGIRDGHRLPLFEANEQASSRAREVSRLQLLEGGQIPSLPEPKSSPDGISLKELGPANAILQALGVEKNCTARLEGSLAWGLQLPGVASIMPHGMVHQAAGVEQDGCRAYLARYHSPVSQRDALEYHFTMAQRAEFQVQFFDTPELQLRAQRRDQNIAVHVRQGPGGMSEIDLVHWQQ